LHILSIASFAGAVNFIVTIHNMRTRGMTWMRIPLFVWAIETYSILRDAVLYQHVFWFFGHPEVYIMVLPVFGMISEIIPVFARKPIFGYTAVAFSTAGITFFSLLVWAHHMFTTGLGTGL